MCCSYVIFAQCPGEYLLFYNTPPKGSLYEIQQNRINLTFINQSQNPTYNIYFYYQAKGTDSKPSDIYNVNFIELNQQIHIELDDLLDDVKYDLFVCDKFVGEFQDARELLEITIDYEFQRNRLYHTVVSNSWVFEENNLFPTYGDLSISSKYNLNQLVQEEDNNYQKVYIEYGNTAFYFYSLKALREKIPLVFSADILRSENSFFSTSLDAGNLGRSPFWSSYNSFYETPDIGTWYKHERLLSKGESTGQYPFYFPDEDTYLLFLWQGLWGSPISGDFNFIDNIEIRALGDRKEICAETSISIYGKPQSEEGIYSDTILNSVGLLDSVIYTTLIQHPPLFIDRISNNHYRATGYWQDYSWLDCSTGTVLGTDRDFYPEENSSFYLKVNDTNCEEETSCEELNNLSLIEENKEFNIYPNPSSGLVNVDGQGMYGYEVIDTWGRVILSDVFRNQKSFVQIDLSKKSKGVYYIKLLGKFNSKFEKVVIH